MICLLRSSCSFNTCLGQLEDGQDNKFAYNSGLISSIRRLLNQIETLLSTQPDLAKEVNEVALRIALW